MRITWTRFSPPRWAVAALGVLFAATAAPAQTPGISLRGGAVTSRTVFAVGTVSIPNPLYMGGGGGGGGGGGVPRRVNATYFVSGTLNPTGSFIIPPNASKPQFVGFTDQAAVLPGAIQPAALNNGSLQRNIGNIASGALGDGLTANGIMPDPDFIFSALGNGNNGNNGNNGQPGQPVPGQVNAARAARFRAMLADQMVQAQMVQANWNFMNAARVNNLAAASQARTPAYSYGPAFTATSSLTNSFGPTASGDTGTTFNGFSKDTDASETILKSDGPSSASSSSSAKP
jgi:hypothetical protein